MDEIKQKKEIIEEYKIHETDTGSDEVQAALLTNRIKKILEHLKSNPKDIHSRRGLVKLVSRRRKVISHLKLESEKRYNELIKKLRLKK